MREPVVEVAMARRKSRRQRRAARAVGVLASLGRLPLPPRPEQVITPKPKRKDRAAEKQRLRRLARDPHA
ncbi:MAG TPA: hypothetical protein VF406_18200 [Thermodesulfobacteriota bacterium]